MKLFVKVFACLNYQWRKSEEINGGRDKKKWDHHCTTNTVDVLEEGKWMATEFSRRY